MSKIFFFFSFSNHKIKQVFSLVLGFFSGLFGTFLRLFKVYFYRYFFFKFKLNFKRFIIKYISPFLIKIEQFIGFSFIDFSNSLSLASLTLILFKLITFIFLNIQVSPIISYLLLLNLTLSYLTINLYHYFQENVLVKVIKVCLGSHYIYNTLDHLKDNDERILLSFGLPVTLYSKLKYKIACFFYPIFRKIFKLFIYLKIILINKHIYGYLFIFVSFQLLIFNNLVLITVFVSLILNLTRNLFLLSDDSIFIVKSELYRLFKLNFHQNNHQIISFWILRGLFSRQLFLECKKERVLSDFNEMVGKPYLITKIKRENLTPTIKRYFVKIPKPPIKQNVTSIGFFSEDFSKNFMAATTSKYTNKNLENSQLLVNTFKNHWVRFTKIKNKNGETFINIQPFYSNKFNDKNQRLAEFKLHYDIGPHSNCYNRSQLIQDYNYSFPSNNKSELLVDNLTNINKNHDFVKHAETQLNFSLLDNDNNNLGVNVQEFDNLPLQFRLQYLKKLNSTDLKINLLDEATGKPTILAKENAEFFGKIISPVEPDT